MALGESPAQHDEITRTVLEEQGLPLPEFALPG